jgi:hypothetical protein
MSDKPRAGSNDWVLANPKRFAIFNHNYSLTGALYPEDMRETEPWTVYKGGEDIHAAETYAAAAEFLRNKLQEVS